MQLNHWSCIFYCTAAIYCWNHGIITLSMVWCTWLNPKNQSCVPRGITLFLGAACIGLIERQRNTPTAHTHTRCDKLYICNVQINIIISFAVPTIHIVIVCVGFCWSKSGLYPCCMSMVWALWGALTCSTTLCTAATIMCFELSVFLNIVVNTWKLKECICKQTSLC